MDTFDSWQTRCLFRRGRDVTARERSLYYKWGNFDARWLTGLRHNCTYHSFLAVARKIDPIEASSFCLFSLLLAPSNSRSRCAIIANNNKRLASKIHQFYVRVLTLCAGARARVCFLCSRVARGNLYFGTCARAYSACDRHCTSTVGLSDQPLARVP